MAKDTVRRPRAETPKGFRDYFGAEVVERQAMLATIAEVYRMHGFEPLETSAVETVEALGKFLPDVDRPNEGVFAWQDEAAHEGKGGDWLALRYDLTAPLARVAAQYRNDLPFPYRRYAMGPVWRNEKPGPGRFRQFYQCDADTVGSASVAADAEMCMMLCDTLEAVGIHRYDYVVKVNNRKVLNGVMEAAKVLDPTDPERYAAERGIVLRAIDKMDRLGAEGVRALLGAGRRDESGDFTKGAGLAGEQVEVVMSFVNAKDDVRRESKQLASILGVDGSTLREANWSWDYQRTHLGHMLAPDRAHKVRNELVLKHLRQITGTSLVGQQGVEELEIIAELLDGLGYGPDRIMIDPSVVRGLGYYTGPVYEAELTFEIPDEKGRPRQFGSVAGGGRYDDLVKRFTGQEVPATGVSIGVDRLMAALRAKRGAVVAEAGPVIVTVMDRDRMADYMKMAADFRNSKDEHGKGIRAEVYLGNPKSFGNQLKYADKRGSTIAVIQGANEAAQKQVNVKDLRLGAYLSQLVTSSEKWGEQIAQRTVPREDLVREVQRIRGISSYLRDEQGNVVDQDGNVLVPAVFF